MKISANIFSSKCRPIPHWKIVCSFENSSKIPRKK